MEFSEIAETLGIEESTARQLVSRGLRKIIRNHEAERFAAVVLLSQYMRAKTAHIRCGSIECRPEKWIFF